MLWRLKVKATSDVVVVGAGPYGLSAAAHLNDVRSERPCLWEAMSFWIAICLRHVFAISLGSVPIV